MECFVLQYANELFACIVNLPNKVVNCAYTYMNHHFKRRQCIYVSTSLEYGILTCKENDVIDIVMLFDFILPNTKHVFLAILRNASISSTIDAVVSYDLALSPS